MIMNLISYVFLIFALNISLIYLIWVFFVFFEFFFAWRKYRHTIKVSPGGFISNRFIKEVPPISIVVPAFNEQRVIIDTIRSLLHINYPLKEIIIVNDGSTDDTLSLLDCYLDLAREKMASSDGPLPHQSIKGVYYSRRYHAISVIDKANGGKADALNAGVNSAKAPLVCVIDADTIVDEYALFYLSQPFIEHPNEMVAVGGTILVKCFSDKKEDKQHNHRNQLLVNFQILEYLRVFLISRIAWSAHNLPILISGAFGLFSKEALLAVGGYSIGSIGEDIDLTMKLQLYGTSHNKRFCLDYVADAVCWTEVPPTLNALSLQRRRWQRGAMEVFGRFNKPFLKIFSSPLQLFTIMRIATIDVFLPLLELSGFILLPLACILGYLGLHIWMTYLFFIIMQNVSVSVLAMFIYSCRLKMPLSFGQIMKLVSSSFIEVLGFRQLICFWRIQALFEYYRGDRSWVSDRGQNHVKINRVYRDKTRFEK